jgi:hypothetical protein
MAFYNRTEKRFRLFPTITCFGDVDLTVLGDIHIYIYGLSWKKISPTQNKNRQPVVPQHRPQPFNHH